MPTTLIGLIDYNSPRMTNAAILDLNTKFPDAKIAVVWNGVASTGTSSATTSIFPGVNTGFAGGVNLLIEEALSGDYDALWLLNNDCVANPDALDEYRYLESTCDADVFTSVTLLGDTDTIWYGGGTHDPKTLTQHHSNYSERAAEGRHGESFATDWASGANMYIPRRTLTTAGPFDERFFLYLEELEWQLRNQLRVRCSSRPLATHHAGATTKAVAGDVEFFFTARNRVLLARAVGGKHLRSSRFWGRWISDFLVRPLAKGSPHQLPLALRALAMQGRSGPECITYLIARRA